MKCWDYFLHFPDKHLKQNIAKGTMDVWVSTFAKIIALTEAINFLTSSDQKIPPVVKL